MLAYAYVEVGINLALTMRRNYLSLGVKMDLFTLIVAEDKIHKNFKSVLRSEQRLDREGLQLWCEGFPDRDGKFVKEFQTTFNSSFWEIYLYAMLKEVGAKLDFSHPAPDFFIELKGQKIIVEAAIAAAAEGKTPEWEKDFYKEPPIRFRQMNIESIIRLANAICSKYKKYKNSYSGLKHVKSLPFVLAIAPFEQPDFNLQYDGPISALLYDQYVDEDVALDNPVQFPFGKAPIISLGTVEKANGAEIELGFFNDERFSEISAVILSTTATWGKVAAMTSNPDLSRHVNSVWFAGAGDEIIHQSSITQPHIETIRDGLMVFHNNFAKNPLNYELFDIEGVVQVFFDPLRKQVVRERRGRCLISRFVLSNITSNDPADFG